MKYVQKRVTLFHEGTRNDVIENSCKRIIENDCERKTGDSVSHISGLSQREEELHDSKI